MKYLIRPFLSILSIPALSRIYGWLTHRKRPKFLIKKFISFFAKHYKIDMNEYMGETTDYESLGDFFVRKLDPSKRPLKKNKDFFLSPADGFLTNVETIFEDRAIQAKKIYYKISEFIQEDIDYSIGWHIATIYLSPNNYHRFHHTIDADLEAYIHKKGALYPVNKMGTNSIKALFNRNERIITRYRVNGIKFFIAAVGATFVGSIKMEFIDIIKRDNKWKSIANKVNQLDEMGRFDMGSTIIMAIPKSLASPVENIIGKEIQVGKPIFKLN